MTLREKFEAGLGTRVGDRWIYGGTTYELRGGVVPHKAKRQFDPTIVLAHMGGLSSATVRKQFSMHKGQVEWARQTFGIPPAKVRVTS